MRAYVNQDTCIGCGACASICSEVFTMDDSGKAEVTTQEFQSELEDVAEAARASCPVSAITVTDNPDNHSYEYEFSQEDQISAERLKEWVDNGSRL